MGFSRSLAAQLARPNGSAGRLLGHAMDVANRKPMRLAVDMLDARSAEWILDAGCGTGAAMAEVLDRARCRVFGVDPSRTMLQAASRRLAGANYRQRHELHCADLDNIPFAPGSFDAALALNVLYFCDAEGRMLGKLREALKPGGRLVAYVTHRETMENWPFARASYHRLFDETELANMALAAGFALARIDVHDVAVTRTVRGLLLRAER